MKYLLRRIGFYLIALWVAVTMNFFVPRMLPGDPAQALIARFQGKVDPNYITSLRLEFGLDNRVPLWQQYLNYLNNTAHGNFGLSINYFPTPVVEVVKQSLPWTLGLVGVATVISALLGTLLGIFVAWKRGTRLDQFLPPLLTFFSAVPYFWFALLILYYLAFQLKLFPLIGGYGLDVDPQTPDLSYYLSILWHAILPATTIVITSLAGWMVGMRNAMIMTLSEDYVLFAQAKGLSDRFVMITYAARNAILPNVANFALSLGFVVGGSLVMETVFSYPGIGYTLLQAVQSGDYPLMQGLFLVIAVAVLCANFLADLVYLALDPRVREGRS